MAEDAHDVVRRSLVAPGNYPLNPSHDNSDNGNNGNNYNGRSSKNVQSGNAMASKNSRKLSETSMGPLARPVMSIPTALKPPTPAAPAGVVGSSKDKGNSIGSGNGNIGFPSNTGNNGTYGGLNALNGIGKYAENLTTTLNKEIEELLIRFTQAMAQPPVYSPYGVNGVGNMQGGIQLPSSPQHDPLTTTAVATATATTGMGLTATAKATATSTTTVVGATAGPGSATMGPVKPISAAIPSTTISAVTATAKATTDARITEMATTAASAITKATAAATKTPMGTIAAAAMGVKASTSAPVAEGKTS
ncbi:hypothetical protein Vafri_15303 [Volvox africanus]|uniref:Uncharacterized protein n=1 Tax=Volvox africanus TaxID=51714 RepID=A0A8J4BFV8_9CHLO|nr:hypothetical protein Vafri_15303 [Volvox africanus]